MSHKIRVFRDSKHYLFSPPPSWNDSNCSYAQPFTPSDVLLRILFFAVTCILPVWGTTLGPWTALFLLTRIRQWWRNYVKPISRLSHKEGDIDRPDWLGFGTFLFNRWPGLGRYLHLGRLMFTILNIRMHDEEGARSTLASVTISPWLSFQLLML